MFCPQCGSDIKEGTAFCPQCGTRVDGETVAQSPAASPTATPLATELGAEPAPKKKRTKLVIGIVAVVVVCIGIGIGVWWKMDQDAKQAAWEHAHTSLVTQIFAEVPEFDDTATAIPVQVSGTDLDGNQVDEVQFMRPGSMRIVTLAGNYTLRFPGGYFTGTGKVVKAPEATLTINPAVDEESGSGTSAGGQAEVANPAESVGFTIVPDLEVTEELIREIEDIASQDPEDEGKANNLGEKAGELHDQAVAAEEQRKAEEEARRAAEEAERRAAEEAARRANPASVNSVNGPVTLKGRVVREEWPTSRTQMGWSAVAYFLELDAPVEATFNANGSPTTQTLTRVQIYSIEQGDTEANKGLDTATSPEWQPYVGQYIAVSGTLYHTGTAHTLTKALFQNPSLVEVL